MDVNEIDLLLRDEPADVLVGTMVPHGASREHHRVHSLDGGVVQKVGDDLMAVPLEERRFELDDPILTAGFAISVVNDEDVHGRGASDAWRCSARGWPCPTAAPHSAHRNTSRSSTSGAAEKLSLDMELSVRNSASAGTVARIHGSFDRRKPARNPSARRPTMATMPMTPRSKMVWSSALWAYAAHAATSSSTA